MAMELFQKIKDRIDLSDVDFEVHQADGQAMKILGRSDVEVTLGLTAG